MTETTIRWGIAGPGLIARRFAEELPFSQTGLLVAVGSRSLARARALVDELPHSDGVAAYGDYEALISAPDVDAIYIATVHTTHVPLAVAALEAGKHVICEKPLALNRAGAERVVAAARASGRYFAEGFMYRFHPQVGALVHLLSAGTIGAVRHIDSSFSFASDFAPDHRLMDASLAGGGILDVGCYSMSAARLVAGAAVGRDFADPVDLVASGTIGPTGVDEWATASLVFASGITAHVRCGIRFDDDNRVAIYGELGRIVLPSPWVPDEDDGAVIVVDRTDEPQRTLRFPSSRQYALQADAVAQGKTESRFMRWGDSVGNADALERWRRAIGLWYPFED